MEDSKNEPGVEASIAPRPSWAVLPSLDEVSRGGTVTAPTTVLQYLVQRFPRIGEDRWQRRFERGLVLGPDGPLGPDAAYVPHWRVGYYRELEAEPSIPFAVEVLHEDADLLVVDKPHFLPVIPSGRFVRECLLYRLEKKLGEPGLAAAHRLDRMTAGLVLVARRPEARAAYSELFAQRRVTKIYQAWGQRSASRSIGSSSKTELRPGATWDLEQHISPGQPFFRMQSQVPSQSTPANATTRVELLEIRAEYYRFRLIPETGKTHQLRLCLAELGFPIVGDRLYPDLQPEVPDDFDQPLRLLAQELIFEDPITGEARHFRSRQGLKPGS